ncbi:hypothetical protein X777_06784, partial [Ooceraea biroi]
VLYLGRALAHRGRQILHVHADLRFLLQLETQTLIRMQEIAYLLLVDLQVAGSHQVLHVLRAADVVEYVLEGARDDAAPLVIHLRAFHCVRLAGAGLPIGEYSAIETVQYRGHQRPDRFLVQILLTGVPIVDRVEGEHLDGLAGRIVARMSHLNHTPGRDHVDHAAVTTDGLPLVHRTTSHDHLHALRRYLGARARPHALFFPGLLLVVQFFHAAGQVYGSRLQSTDLPVILCTLKLSLSALNLKS